MAAKKFVLRCKTDQGQHTIDSLSGDSTVSDLKTCLHDLTGIGPDSIKVLAGFPPKPLNLENDNCKLDNLNVRSGDTLIIEKERIVGVNVHNAMQRVVESKVPEVNNCQAGILMRHVVPANNSCLFTSIYFIVSGGDTDLKNSNGLRQIISDTVAADPEKFNEAFLAMPNKQYCTWIQNEEHWGGAIELSIMSEYYGLEIVAVDTQSLKLHHFGESREFDHRIFLIYDGIHYDPLVMELVDGSKGMQTFFQVSDNKALEMALEIAKEAKSSHQYTDVHNFSLRCLSCNKGLRGNKEASEHALSTKHCEFGEI